MSLKSANRKGKVNYGRVIMKILRTWDQKSRHIEDVGLTSFVVPMGKPILKKDHDIEPSNKEGKLWTR
jgi:hypothetical protein